MVKQRLYVVYYHYENGAARYQQYVHAATAESATRKFKHAVTAKHRVIDKVKLFSSAKRSI